ncbi:MAG: hypothetical protein KY468_18705 [Armatimonadetes bacterium]|nr:hypothetical protein [Armatimonadota bacterium]
MTGDGPAVPEEAEELKAVVKERVRRGKPTAEESLRRMEEFEKRKESFVAAVRKDPD